MTTARLTLRILAALLAILMVVANTVAQQPGLVAVVLPPHAVAWINALVPILLGVGHELMHQFPALAATEPAAPAPTKESP